MPYDSDRLARRTAREHERLLSHLPPLDPLRRLDPQDESVELLVAVDVDLAVFETTDHQQRMLVAEGIREKADFTLYAPEWRRLYCLANDGESVAIADGDPSGSDFGWAAVYRRGELVASLVEPQQFDI